MIRHLRSLILVSVLVIPLTAKSQMFTGTIAGGMGGAGRAAVDGGEAAFLNPATIAHLRQYFIGGHYQRGSHPLEGDFSRYSIQAADGTPGNLIPGAFAYTKQSIDLPTGEYRSDTDYQTAVAAMISDNIALGIAGHYLKQAGTSGDSEQINGHFGVLITPTETLGIGFVAYDISPFEKSAPVTRRLNPTYGAGFHYLFPDILRVRFDVVRPDIQVYQNHRTNVMAGLESYLRPDFVIRLGSQWLEVSDQMNITAGFGFHGPRLSFDYSFQKDLRAAGGVRHLIDLWLPL